MLHLLFLFESTISERQSFPMQIEPPETSSKSATAQFIRKAKTFGIFNAAKRIYSSNINTIDKISV